MRFQYGKQDWTDFERGEENCYLMTNGLGGFSSLSMTGSCSRNDQAVLMACTRSPNNRYNMIHRLEESLEIGDRKSIFLSSQDFQCHERRENGFKFQTLFMFEDYPVWTYLADGVEIVRTIALMNGKNSVGISYCVRNRSRDSVTLRVRPHLQFVPKGNRLSTKQEFVILDNKVIKSNGQLLYFRTNGEYRELPLYFREDLYYSDDVRDGKMPLGRTAVNHEISVSVASGECAELEIIYGMDENLPDMKEILNNVSDYRRGLKEKYKDDMFSTLAAAAEQFISHRSSTGQKTILAGFPFFEDWGRDTMIALVGCCLSTGEYDTAKSILRTFIAHCRKGLMPNLFMEGTEAAAYNTADASLLFILAVYEHYKRTGDNDFVKEAYPVMEEIVGYYAKGTDYGIHMDEDGLILAGQEYDQVTWMDVRVEDILPTPRHGKPVEINAYWYNALRIMEKLAPDTSKIQMDYGEMADRVQSIFEKLYWNEDRGCLRDVISGTKADEQIRCNQIWVVSLPFSLLSGDKEKMVVETVFRELYTPVGLRSLSPEDEQYHSFYGGAQLDRDLAYHQGTVWVFPLGGYYLAYLKVNGYSENAKAYVREQLKGIETALREGCVGQLPEIYDGDNPVKSKGCFAQAWSVGEILRVYEALEMQEDERTYV